MHSSERDHPYQRWTLDTPHTKTRAQLIAWLQWNDPNGAYSDADQADQFDRGPLDQDELVFLVAEQIRQNR